MSSILTYGFGNLRKRGFITIYGFGQVYRPIVQLHFSLSIQQDLLFALER